MIHARIGSMSRKLYKIPVLINSLLMVQFMWPEKFNLPSISVPRKSHPLLNTMKSHRRETWLLLWIFFLLKKIIISVLPVFTVSLYISSASISNLFQFPFKLTITFSKLEPDSNHVASLANMMDRKRSETFVISFYKLKTETDSKCYPEAPIYWSIL